jgi:tetratricopeptide (TPR) repeat protein
MAPDMAEAWLARGSAYYLNGSFEFAVRDLARARQLAPQDTEIAGVYASALRKLGERRAVPVAVVEAPKQEPAVVVEKPKPVAEVVAGVEKPKPAGPTTAKGWQEEGRLLAARNDFKGAIAAYSRAIELNPKLSMAWNGRGYARMRLADYKAAVEDFTGAIRVNPSYANAYRNRAAAFRAMGNTAMAGEDSEMAKELGELKD